MNIKKIKKSSKKIKKTDLGITVLIIIGILAVFNFFSYQIFYRWDLTQNKVYSISKVSKKTVGELSDIVNIKAYFSKDLPSKYLILRQEVADILDEYQNYSNGKIKVEFIDPGDDEEMKQQLYMIGIPQLTFQTFEKDKAQLINGYMGLAVSFGDKTEVIPAIKQDTRDLEYQITTAIKKVIANKVATIGFLSSNSTIDAEKEMNIAYKELQKLYSIQSVSLENSQEIPANIDILVIIGPKDEFTEDQLKAINSFVMRGGSMLILHEGVTIGDNLMASANKTGLDGLLEKYGILMNSDLIADSRSGMASFSQGFITFTTNYAFWPKVTSDGFNKDNSAVANLGDVIFPWASSVEITGDTSSGGNGGNKASELAFTSENAHVIKDNFNINPQSSQLPTGEAKKYDIAVMANGEFNNAYGDESGVINKSSSSRIIVVGDSDFIKDNILNFLAQTQQPNDNPSFFLNLVDSLSFGEDIISIRSKTVSSRPIKEDITEGEKAAIRYINIFGLTIIVILFGMFRYYTRRKSRFVDEL